MVFRTPLRLLPLGIAIGAAGIVFGFLSLAGGSLTMASIAVLPVLIGLSVDYAIQFQARFGEAVRAGSSPPRAAVEAAARGGPVIATAGLATVAGFAVLVLSPIPMVRGFALLLVLGIVVAFALALTVGLSALSLLKPATGKRAPRSARARASRGLPPAARPRRSRVRSARPRAGGGRARPRLLDRGPGQGARGRRPGGDPRLGRRDADTGDLRHPPARAARPARAPGRRRARAGHGHLGAHLRHRDRPRPQRAGGDLLDARLRAARAGAPWVRRPKSDLQGRATEICPEISLPDFLYAGGQATPSRQQIRTRLRLLPPYVAQALVTTDPDTGKPGNTGVITFGIKVMPFDQQKELIDDIRAQVDPPGTGDDPPPGVSAQVLGLPVLAADANSALSGSRYLVTVAGLLAVALVLVAVYRSASRALVPLIPIVLATGWSSLVLWVAGVPLNPMSATLGALVIAIATEFSVLLSARYHEERRRGGTMGEALRRAYARTGAAVLASGITAIAGFAVLVLTDIRMLRDFGLVTVFDLGVALVGVLLVLPAALVWSEGGFEPLAALAARLAPPRAAGARRCRLTPGRSGRGRRGATRPSSGSPSWS